MNDMPSPAQVRQLVTEHCQQLSGDPDNSPQIAETILVQDESHIGRSYRAGEIFVMWMIDVGLLQFYDAAGKMLDTIDLQENRQDRVAA